MPDALSGAVAEGACVSVPFGGREMVGYIFDLTDTPPEIDGIKDLSAVITDACALPKPLMMLASWMSDYYSAPLAQSTRAIVPEVMSATVNTIVRLIDPERVHPTSTNQKRLVGVLQGADGEMDSDILKVKSGIDKFAPTLRQLRDRGVVEVIRTIELPKAKPRIVNGLQISEMDDLAEPHELSSRAHKQAAILKELAESPIAVRQSELLRRVGTSSSPARALIDKGLAERVKLRVRRQPFATRAVESHADFTLTQGQQDALQIIAEGLNSGTPQTTLLYGVTGSGKTEVYLRSISDVLDAGGSCIALCPEISLTAHLMDAYRARFGDQIAILHSKLSMGERHDEWRRIESGEAKVVLGPRSAIFAPVRNLKLIVIDEEHEPSYKQDHSPRYSARLAAEERARIEGASVILGSATPSLETFYRTSTGEIRLAVLDKRVDDRPMPEVKTVDQREEFAQGRRNIFSEPLRQGIEDRLSRGEQTILFVNRRGYASFILCRSCGYTARCPNCDVSLTYHSAMKLLKCHHCDESMRAPDVCPKCGGPHFKQFGIGTERVEEEVRKVFPEASVIRMDSDTTRRKNAHFQILDAFREGRADILVGTQMVAKGLDFPNVTLVGVISADTILNLPDFRSAERTFQLLTQVSGRAGRGKKPGEVIVQSFSPENYAIKAAAQQDYKTFYDEEIEYRRELGYPPFSRLINILSSDPVDSFAQTRLEDFKSALESRIQSDEITLMGPAPAPISRLKGMYRWHILIKNRGSDGIQQVIKEVLADISQSVRTGLTIDVDPLTML